jgi:uncharacterized membrane protein
MLQKFKDKFNAFNEWLAMHTVAFMSSIWCVYLFAFWCMVPSLNSQLSDLVLYISSAVIQLIALPLIMVGQNLQGRAVEVRAEQDHQYIIEMHAEIKQLLEEVRDMMKDVHHVMQDVDDVIAYVDNDANTVPSGSRSSAG